MDDKGTVTQIAVYTQDITERKKSEKMLQDSEYLLNESQRVTRIGSYITDFKVGIWKSSKTLDDIFGIDKNYERSVEGWLEIVHPEHREELSEYLKNDVIAKRNRFNKEYRILRINDKKERWVQGIGEVEFDEKGNISQMIGTIQDITERKKADEAIKESEERLRIMTDSLPALIGYVGKDMRYQFVNAAYQEWFGISKDEFIGKSVKEVLGESYLKEVSLQLKEAFSGKTVTYESMINHRSKGVRTNQITLVPHIGRGGEILGLYVFTVDITEHKQLEEERLKASKLESIGILAGGIAHDFNNILAAILGNVSLAKLSLDNKSVLSELLHETEKASIRATVLTQQLLTFAKGGAPVKEIVELTELIRETTGFSLRGSNVKYRISIPSDLWTVDVDKGQISQVIGNLVINAQQAMPEGGIINISAKNVKAASKDNLPLSEENYLKISVTDKGHGIPEENLSKIFDPYFTSKQKGSGLGLATAYSIIHRHDGHLAVKSKVGVGTTFTIYLKASSKKVEGKETAKEESEVLTGKILLMDDEKSIRKVTGMMLRSLGNEVEVAFDGEEAIELYKKAMKSDEPFDVVIMDLTIPGGMGGKEAIKKLLKINPDAKAIVSSGYSNDPVISYYQEHGFSGYIPKPYRLEELKKVLNEVLKKR